MAKVVNFYGVCTVSSLAAACFRKMFLVLLLLLSCALVSPLSADESAVLSPDEIITRLQDGGYVFYVRHAATDHTQQDRDLTNFKNCETQRNLSQKGKDQSRVFGDAIRALNIKVDGIYTSPYCRCVDTVEIAFGRYVIVNKLRAAFAANKDESARLADYLKMKLSEKPRPGFNTILVSHTANLRELTGIWPKPEGVAHVFRPLGEKGYQHIGFITPDEWSRLLVSTKQRK